MPLPCPGPASISLNDIQTEFGGATPISINEYYANGSLVPVGTGNIPANGQISFADFFCAVNELVLIVSVTTTNLNLQSAFDAQFGANTWTNTRPKRVIVNAGVVVGSSSICFYAMTVTSGRGGTLRIDNYGSIQGAGGAVNSGMGGNAILADSPVSINNQGTIYGGGGGGGAGGQGGTGYYNVDTSTSACLRPENAGGTPGCPGGYYEIGFGQGDCCQTYNFCCGLFNCGCVGCASYIYTRYCRLDVYTAGAAGGTGGTGQGYGQNATGGAGSYDPGGNAGVGGNGGTGGSFGQNGTAGTAGAGGNVGGGAAGGPGGYAGFYVTRSTNITWTNLGTVAGRSDSFLSNDGFVVLVIGSNTVDLNLQTAFDNAFGYQTWNNGVPKRLIINPGVVVGGSNTGTYAITIPAGRCGPLEIINYGSIQGAGAPAGNGNAGGNAIYAGSTVTINNQGSIYGGGGGGGAGGQGGTGYYTYDCSYYQAVIVGSGYYGYDCNSSCGFEYSCISGCNAYEAGGDNPGTYYVCDNCGYYQYVSQTCEVYTAGAAGGAGGTGQGYGQNASAGAGSYNPGGNAGVGGQGGTGGSFGQNGTAGAAGASGNAGGGGGGYPGGAAGYYIVGGGNVTWAAFGTRLGNAG